jgi:predicted PurR-regulated permease PerM
MTRFLPDQETFSKTFVLLLVVAISLIFLAMIRGFVEALLLAAIFAGMLQPMYGRLLRAFRGRAAAAAIVTLLIFLLVLILPLSGFLGVVVSQALEVSQSVGPAIERLVSQPDELERLLDRIPFLDRLQPYQDQLLSKIGELAGTIGTFLVSQVAAATRGTALFFFNLFIMLYAMFFFLQSGRAYLEKILYYMPLSSKDEDRMVERFVSVTRATLKGTLVIGIVQGGLAGLAFWAAGIQGAAFWATVMAVLSIIPGIGSAIVWIPAAVYLFAVGRPGTAVGLTLWCGLIVGTADNFLRPRLVGRDTKMSDLMVLLGTLGGLLLFGAVGIIIGPIIAALFLTVWEIYGETFKEYLPDVEVNAGAEKAGTEGGETG